MMDEHYILNQARKLRKLLVEVTDYDVPVEVDTNLGVIIDFEHFKAVAMHLVGDLSLSYSYSYSFFATPIQISIEMELGNRKVSLLRVHEGPLSDVVVRLYEQKLFALAIRELVPDLQRIYFRSEVRLVHSDNVTKALCHAMHEPENCDIPNVESKPKRERKPKKAPEVVAPVAPVEAAPAAEPEVLQEREQHVADEVAATTQIDDEIDKFFDAQEPHITLDEPTAPQAARVTSEEMLKDVATIKRLAADVKYAPESFLEVIKKDLVRIPTEEKRVASLAKLYAVKSLTTKEYREIMRGEK